MLLDCAVGEDSWQFLGQKGDPTAHPKGNQSWVFIGRTDAEAETLILWTPDVKNSLIWKDPDAGKDWRQKRKTEDEMVGWHHPLNGHEFEQAPGDGEGQGGLGCCSPWGHKESDMTEQLNSNNRWGKKGVPAAASGQKPTCHCRRCKRQGSIPGSGRAPGGGHGNSLQYSCLEKPMDRGAWWATVHGISKSQTQLKWLSTHTCRWKERVINCFKRKRNC